MSGSRPATEPADTPVENLDAVAPPFQEATNQPADAQADSSPAADDGETKATLLDVTRRAAKEAASPPADDGGDNQATKAGESAEADKPKGEADKPEDNADDKSGESEDEPPPFDKHPRWQKLQRERAEMSQKIAEMQPLAQRQQQILDYMDANGLTPDDVRQGFAIMAALRQDPAEAWKLMEPIVRSVRAFMGDELPADLQERVDSGLVDEDTARETARLRHRDAFLAERGRRLAQSQAQQQEQAQATAEETARVSAVDAWWERKQAHPDAQTIAPFLHGETLRVQAEWTQAKRRFDTPEAATALMDEVWTALQKRLAPTRKPIRSTPGSPPSPAAPKAPPTTLKDAIRAAL